MKHLIIAFLLCFSLTSLSAQTYYKVTATEMFVYNNITNKWDLYKKNLEVDITIVLEEEFVSIQANSPTMFKIYGLTKQSLNTEKITGYRYEARDLKKDRTVKLDIVKLKDISNVVMLSVVNESEGYNLRYYLVNN